MKLKPSTDARFVFAARIAFCVTALAACAQQARIERALPDAAHLEAGQDTGSGAFVDAGTLQNTNDGKAADPAVNTRVGVSNKPSQEPECNLDRECRIISEDISDCSANRIVVSEQDPRWVRYLHLLVNAPCRTCIGSLDALAGVCEAGRCRAVHFTLTELQACEVDDDCALGYSTPQFCFCSSWAPDPTLAFNKNRPSPGTDTYNRCLVSCPAVACPLMQDAGPPRLEARCNESKRCEVAERP